MSEMRMQGPVRAYNVQVRICEQFEKCINENVFFAFREPLVA